LQTTKDRLSGTPKLMTAYKEPFKKVVTGRFGTNQGMEKGIGDQKFRDAIKMFDALKLFNDAEKDWKVTINQRKYLAQDTGFGTPEQSIKMNIGEPGFNLLDPELESVLMKTDIERFKKAIKESRLPAELKDSMLAALTVERSVTPANAVRSELDTERMLRGMDVDLTQMHHDGKRISSREDVALLSELLAPDTFKSLMQNLKSGHAVSVPERISGGKSRV
jgi:hypothetical protein